MWLARLVGCAVGGGGWLRVDAEQLADLRAELVAVGSASLGRRWRAWWWVGVTHLHLDVREVIAGDNHERDVRAPERVRGDVRQD